MTDKCPYVILSAFTRILMCIIYSAKKETHKFSEIVISVFQMDHSDASEYRDQISHTDLLKSILSQCIHSSLIN